MDKLKTELIRIFIFLSIIFIVATLKWWTIPVVLIFFPWVPKRIKNKRNGKTNIGYLVNYLTNRLAEKI